MNKKYYAMVVLALSVGMIAPAVIVSAATQAERPSVSSVANDTGKSKPKSANSAEALRAENRTKEAVNSTHNMNNNMHDDSVGRGGSDSSGGHGIRRFR